MISDPGLPGPHNDESIFIVSESSFQRKLVTTLDEHDSKTEIPLYEGTLDIIEMWKSVWQRQRVEVLNLGFKWLFAPLFVALGAGLMLPCVDRSGSTNDAAESRSGRSQDVEDAIEQGSQYPGAEGNENQPTPDESSSQSKEEKGESSDNTTTDEGERGAKAGQLTEQSGPS